MGTSRFSARSCEPELMDTEVVDFEVFDECLRDLERINRQTRAYPPTLDWLRSVRQGSAPEAPISIWDIGSGGGDMLRRIRENDPLPLALTGMDMNPWSKRSAERRTPAGADIAYETADIFTVDPDRRADCIISSLFTHHLSDDELIRFLQWMETHSERGWFINDLHRHPLPYYFIGAITRLLNLNRLVRHDAPVSVLRAFTARDWRRLLAQAGLPTAEISIRWHWPFRYCVSRRKQ